jgi:HlyD family secretion protein
MNTFIHHTRNAIVLTTLVCSLGCNKAPVIYPQRKDIIETVYASGKIVSENEYKVSSLINGTIVKKLVKDGDTIIKGQLLYVISHDAAKERFNAALKNYHVVSANLTEQSPVLNDLTLSVQNAQVKFTNDSATWHRYNTLWARNIGTKSNLDNAYTNYLISLNQKRIAEQKYLTALNDLQVSHSNAQSQLSTARKDLKEYFIRSNTNAVVYQTYKEAGEAVYSNEMVALLGECSDRVIRLAVDQQDIDKIKIGQQVLLQADITGSTVYKAKVCRIYPVMNEADQTFRVDARFTQLPQQSFIHSSIEANIIVQTKNKALILPRTAFVNNDTVLIHIKGKETKAHVQTGISTLDYVEIVSGIDEKTPVLLTQK